MAMLHGVATTTMEYNSRDKEVFERVKMIGDGHCLFRAMSMALWGTQHRHEEVRTSIVNHVVSNWLHYYERILNTLGEEFNSPEKYANLMGNVQKRIYGSEFEIIVFCEVYKRNAAVYREKDGKQRICGKDTIFKVANFNINEDYTTCDFVFQGIEKGHESEGHYDLLIKREVLGLEASDDHYTSNSRHDTNINKPGIAENRHISSGHAKRAETNNLQSLESKKKSLTIPTHPDVLQKLIEFLNKKGCCNKKLKKRSKERHALFKEAALLIFGDYNNKHMLSLNKLYEKNVSKFITEVTTEKGNQQSLLNKGVNEKYAEVANIVLNTLGEEITKEEVIQQEKIVYYKVYNYYCQNKGWKVSNKNNARKFKHNWNKFLANLNESDIGIKQIARQEETFVDRLKGSRGSVESVIECKSPTYQDLQTSGKNNDISSKIINSSVVLWENECKKDHKFEHFIKELISCHRMDGGVCTWTDFNDIYKNTDNLKNIRSITDSVVLVFKKCMYKLCDNEMIIHISAVGDGLKIEIKESESLVGVGYL